MINKNNENKLKERKKNNNKLARTYKQELEEIYSLDPAVQQTEQSRNYNQTSQYSMFISPHPVNIN